MSLSCKIPRYSDTSLDTDARSSSPNQRDNNKRRAKSHLVELLFAAGFADAAKRVATCNSSYFTLACKNRHSAQMLPTSRCRNRLCPYCAVERQRRSFAKLWPLIQHYAELNPSGRLVLITLTLKNSFEPLRAQDEQFKAAFRRLRRQNGWRERISGALCSYEFKLTPTGWNYHAHILAFRRKWYDQTDLTRNWQEALKSKAAIADIRAISNSSDGLRNLLQYCFKPPDLEQWTINEVHQFQSMSRVKLSDCFGDLRGLKVRDHEIEEATSIDQLFVGCPCPRCGEPLMKVKLSWRELHTYAAILSDSSLRARASPKVRGH